MEGVEEREFELRQERGKIGAKNEESGSEKINDFIGIERLYELKRKILEDIRKKKK